MPTKALGASSPASDRERVGSSWSEGVIISRAAAWGRVDGRAWRRPKEPSNAPIGFGSKPGSAFAGVDTQRERAVQWLPCRHSDVGCLFTSYDFLHNDRQGKRLASLSSTYSPSHPSHLLLWYVVRVGARTQSVAKKCEAGEQEDLGAHLIV